MEEAHSTKLECEMKSPEKPTEFATTHESRSKFQGNDSTVTRNHSVDSQTNKEPRRPIQCVFCQGTFTSNHHLHRHILRHIDEKPFFCTTCDQRFARQEYLDKHQVSRHSSSATLGISMRKHTGERPFACFKCSRTFRYSGDCAKHKKTHNKKSSCECLFCQKCYVSRTQLNSHLLVHLNEKPYFCKLCDECFPYSSSLRWHKKSHLKNSIKAVNNREKQDGQKYQCHLCEKFYSHRDSLRKHLRKYHNRSITEQRASTVKQIKTRPKRKHKQSNLFPKKKTHACEFCGNSYKTQNSLYRHIFVRHPEKFEEAGLKYKTAGKSGFKIFNCELCDKVFRESSGLSSHMRSHTGERPYKCTICDASFKFTSVRKRHERIHTRERPFGCTFCSKNYRNNTHLYRHILAHIGEKPFWCELCGEEFTYLDTRNLHIRVCHTTEKPYKCEHCPKAFHSLSEINVHKDVHDDGRGQGYSCDICAKVFRGRMNLYQHQRRFREDKTCQVCGKIFCTMKSFEFHVKNEHSAGEDYLQGEYEDIVADLLGFAVLDTSATDKPGSPGIETPAI